MQWVSFSSCWGEPQLLRRDGQTQEAFVKGQSHHPPLPGRLPRGAASSPGSPDGFRPATGKAVFQNISTRSYRVSSWCAFGLAFWRLRKEASGPSECWALPPLALLHFHPGDTFLTHSSSQASTDSNRSLTEIHSPATLSTGSIPFQRQREESVCPSFQVKSLCLDSVSKVLRPRILKRMSYEIPHDMSP